MAVPILGQRPSSVRPQNIPGMDTMLKLKPGPDSIILDYFFFDNITEKTPFSDTILDIFFTSYDPSRKTWKENFNLGNTGSAAFPILYDKSVPIGTNYGFDAYRPYRMDEHSFRFYDVNVPLLHFYFTPVGGQQNFVIKTDFARSFKDGIKLSLNYDRINQEGFYMSQDLKHTNFGLSVWYHEPKGRQDLFITFINSVQSENHNGGIKNRTDLMGTFARVRQSISTNLTQAESRFQHRTYMLQHHYRLQDSVGRDRGLELISRLKLQNGYYKYADPGASGADTYYSEFFIDDRGLRNFLGYTMIQLKSELKGGLNNGIFGKVGIDYRLHRLDYEAEKETRNDLFLTGIAAIPLGKNFILDGQAYVGLGSSAGDFLASGKSKIQLSEKLQATGSVSFYRHQHPLQVQKLFINERLIWENSFDKPVGSRIRGEVQFPWLGARIGIQQILENNTLFYRNRTPEISADIFSSSQADLYFKFSFWNIYLENLFAYQTFNNNLYHLPDLYYKFNTYWRYEPFGGKLKLNIGMEGKLIGPYDEIEFFPLLSTFNQGDGRTVYEPFGDLYVAGQISSFRFFVRYENLGDLAQERVYFHIGDYPQFDRKIRLGIGWHFID